jgi:hypothetical protein
MNLVKHFSIIFVSNFQETKFLPHVHDIYNKNRVRKLTKITSSGISLDASQEQIIRESKRIIVILTTTFMNEQAKNTRLIQILNDICLKNENDTIVIVISMGHTDQIAKHAFVNQLQNEPNMNVLRRLANRVKYRFRRNCGFNDAELLDWHDYHFWSKFFYLMPSYKEKLTKIVKIKKTEEKAPKKTLTKENKTESVKIVEEKKPEKVKTKVSKPVPIVAKPNTSRSEVREVSEPPKATPENAVKAPAKTENESNVTTKPSVCLNKRLERSYSNKIHPRQRRTLDEIDDNIDFWQKISAINPDSSTFEYEPIGVALIKGNKESLVKRFGSVFVHGANQVPKLSDQVLNQNEMGKFFL